MKLRTKSLLRLSALKLLASCSETETYVTPTETPITPTSPTLANAEHENDCEWKTETLNVLKDKRSFVTFRHQICGLEKYTKFYVENNGTSIKKLDFDIVADGFHIFEKTDEPISDFIMNLPERIFKVGENCRPKKVSENLWMIDDGLELNAEINQMPYGLYGRNFSGQTVFEIRDDVILNYGTYSSNGGIDKSSIKFSKTSPE